MVRDFKYDISLDTVYITVSENCGTATVFAPNIFSPNGDGINDILNLHAENVKEFSFALYDRWGEQVFKSIDIRQGWNGQYKNKDCPEGVYFYVAQLTFLSGEVTQKKGNVTLVR